MEDRVEIADAAALADRLGLQTGAEAEASAGRAAYEALRARIVRLDLPPGTPLPRAELARDLGVSLTPLRDALGRLAEEGLVRIFARSRTLVAPIDAADIEDAQFLRLALETEAVRRLTREGSPEALDRLRAIHAAQAAAAGDLSRVALFQELDELFHHAIFAGAGQERSMRLLKERTGHLERLRRLFVPDGEAAPGAPAFGKVLSGHAAIIAAIAAGDEAAAADATRAHLRRTVERLAEKRAAYPDFFA